VERKIRSGSRLLAGLLILLLLTTSVLAAKEGSLNLTITGENGAVEGMDVFVYPVAAPDGTLTREFAGSGIEPDKLTDQKKAGATAQTLWQYVQLEGIEAEPLTTDKDGVVCIENLEEGIYLIAGSGEEGVFAPFLVTMPLVINNEADYDISAEPKVSDPDQPTEPTQPGGDPQGPQTGDTTNIQLYSTLAGISLVAVAMLLVLRKKEEEAPEGKLPQ